MTLLKFIPIIIISSVLMISCSEDQSTNNKVNQKETPQALKEDKLVELKYSRSSDLTEELYQELVDKSPLLKTLENDLDAILPKYGEANEEFNKYDAKSNNYYGSAEYKASFLSDSLLKIKIKKLISSSKDNYKSKTNEINKLIEQISRNNTTLKDQHLALKIVLTLPLIEKYQDDNKPNSNKFNDIINNQNKMIFQIDSLTSLP